METTFMTVVTKDDHSNATGLPVPAAAVAALDRGKRPPVVARIGDYTYRTTVAAYGDVFMLPLSAEHRAGAGVKAGDAIMITLELDTQPRTVAVPEDLAVALAGKAGARAAFDALSYTARREHVRQVESAKTAETRARRIAGIVGKC